MTQNGKEGTPPMEPILPSAVVADACVRENYELRIAPPGLAPLLPQWRVSGPVRPVRHYGSVDVFLEAIDNAQRGDILVVDNGMRRDEGCIGDLVTLEVKLAGLGGILIWGLHRDTEDIRRLDLPLFSYGAVSNGPVAARSRDAEAFTLARFGDLLVTDSDWVVADCDGAVFFPAERKDRILGLAKTIWETERGQAERARAGVGLRQQFHFSAYLERRKTDANYSFRQHLRSLKQSIEE